MAWRKPELRDIAAKLSQKELDAYRIHPDLETATDPVADILELTAEMVRGFCRANKQLKLCPTLGTIPEGLMSFAMDYATFDILKRIAVIPNEARKSAWEKAVEVFEKVATGAFIPESYSEEAEIPDDDSNRALPHILESSRRRVLEQRGL